MSICVVVITRDRKEYFSQTLISVINQQTSKKYKIIVSDNSEGDETEDYMQTFHPNIKYIRRRPTLGVDKHFKEAFNEASKSKYFVIFHDDDIMLPEYIESMSEIFAKHSNIAAVGCNAQYINDEGRISRYFLNKNYNNIIINSQYEFTNRYFKIGTDGYAPFPGYMYNNQYVSEKDIEKFEVGKYSDFTFLLKLIKKSQIIWTSKIVMLYRIHKNNDSSVEDIHKRLSLLRYLYSNNIIDRKGPLSFDFRFRCWCSSVRTLKSYRRSKIVWKFIFVKSLFYLITNRQFINEVFKKVIVKWKR